MESLSDDAQDPDSTEYLEAKVLNGQWTELNEVEAALETLLETQAITADCAGTVDSVNVSADTEITQSSASSSGSSDSGNATGGSTGSDAATSGNSSGASQMSGKKRYRNPPTVCRCRRRKRDGGIRGCHIRVQY